MNKQAGCILILVAGLLWVASAQEMSCCGTLPSRFGTKTADGMVWIPAGTFAMGGVGADAKLDEFPRHRVKIDGFSISRTPITNDEFSRFVEVTGYVTTAEIPPKLKELMAQLPPGTPPPSVDMLFAASLVFKPTDRSVSLHNPLVWW